MASLQSIMNVDDDQDGSAGAQHRGEAGLHQYQDPQSQAALGDHSSSFRLSSSMHDPTQSSSSPGFHPFPGALPSPTGLINDNLTDRRRSTASNDSLDPSYSQAYSYGPSSSNPARMVPSPPGSQLPVKLTPVTRKPSRAKKGVPVHVCELCRPPKVCRLFYPFCSVFACSEWLTHNNPRLSQELNI